MSNRVIEFRGLTKDSEWCHGYFHIEGEQAIISRQHGASWKVRAETVGQFTGLTDKNGKEIYSDDYLGDWCVFWGSGKYILQNVSTGDIVDCNEENTQTKEVTGNRFETPREHKAMASDL